MIGSRTLIVSSLWALSFCLNGAELLAQRTTLQEPECFNIHVRLNGQLVDGPQTIIFVAKQNEKTVSLEGRCFKVPSEIAAEKALDVMFAIPGNRIHLTAIPRGFFAGSWDVDLADKSFGREVSLPKRARIKEACAVVFHVGEPETALSQTRCRTILRSKRAEGS